MSGSKRPNEDEEIEAFRRSMRPNPARTAAALVVILTVGIVGIGMAISYGYAESEDRWRTREARPQTPLTKDGSPFILANRRANAQHAVARQAVAIHTNLRPETGNLFANGSGFLISDGLVITAAHVFTGIDGSQNEPISVRCEDVDRKGKVTAFDTLRDVAAISAPGCNGRTLPFSYVEPTVNDGLHVAGYNFTPHTTASHWFQFDTSIIPGVAPDPHRDDIEPELADRLATMKRHGLQPYFALAGELVPGNSGSAVFDDQGRVVGMLVAADSRFNRSYCVSSTVIVEVLRNNGLPLP